MAKAAQRSCCHNAEQENIDELLIQTLSRNTPDQLSDWLRFRFAKIDPPEVGEERGKFWGLCAPRQKRRDDRAAVLHKLLQERVGRA